MLFNQAVYANEVCYSLPVLSVPGSQPLSVVPLTKTVIGGEITGPLFAGDVTHVFRYSAAQCDKVLEAVYRFPLPGDAAVTGVTVRFGTEEIEAELKERQAAEEDYREARRKGRQAALTTRESPDVFTLRLAGLKPDQDVTVRTFFVQLAEATDDGWELRLPLTVAPRFVRSDEKGRHAKGNPAALALDPGHRFSLNITGFGWDDVTCPSHAIAVHWDEDEAAVSLQSGAALADRDCLLRYKSLAANGTPAFYTYDDSGWRYFLALVQGSRPSGGRASAPREIILLVDHSGSMEGSKWEAADRTAAAIIGQMNEQDCFNLGLFHNTCQWVNRREPLAATKENIAKAVAYIERHKDTGGTELGVALEQALMQPRSPQHTVRHLVIITDGEVSDFGRLLRLADDEGKRADGRHIHVVCIDSSPNVLLARQMASRTGGTSLFLTSRTALEEKLSAVAQNILQSVAGSGILTLSQPGGQAAALPYESGPDGTAIHLGGVPLGRPLWVSGRVPAAESLSASLAVDGTPAWEAEAAAGRGHPAVRQLFGAARLLELEFLRESRRERDDLARHLRKMGYAEAADRLDGSNRPLYGENSAALAEDTLRELLVRESLACGVACSETAFIAVRKVDGKPVEETVAVPNALPDEWARDNGVLYDVDGSYDSYSTHAPHIVTEASVNQMYFEARAGRSRPMVLHSYISLNRPVSPATPDEQDEDYDLDIQKELIQANADDAPAADKSARTSRCQTKQIVTLADGSRLLYANRPRLAGGVAVLNVYRATVGEKLILLSVKANSHTIRPGDELRIYRNNGTEPVAVLNLHAATTFRLDLVLAPGDELRLELVTAAGVAWPRTEITACFESLAE